MSNVNWLPDCYRKDPDGNHYKILQLNELAVSELRQDIEAVQAVLELKNATGKTLDLYGAMLDQLRGTLNDEQYRYMLLARIGRNHVKGDYQSVINALVAMFRNETGKIRANDFEFEEDVQSCRVKITKYPEIILSDTDLTFLQMARMVKALLPVCVGLMMQISFWFDVPIHYQNAILVKIQFWPRHNQEILRLNGRWKLDGKYRLSGYDSEKPVDFYPVREMTSLDVVILLTAKQGIRSKTGVAVSSGYDLNVVARSEFYTRKPLGILFLNGDWKLDGSQKLLAYDFGEGDYYPLRVKVSSSVELKIKSESARVRIINNLSGDWKLDGSRKLNSGIYSL